MARNAYCEEEEMTEESRVEVEVGRWTPDGTFTGEVVRFTGEEVGGYTDCSLARSGDDRGITYTLYRVAGESGEASGRRYRVHVKEWSRWRGEDESATLHPFEERGGDDAYGNGPLAYTTYSEDGARRAWPGLFAAIGSPNVRDID